MRDGHLLTQMLLEAKPFFLPITDWVLLGLEKAVLYLLDLANRVSFHTLLEINRLYFNLTYRDRIHTEILLLDQSIY